MKTVVSLTLKNFIRRKTDSMETEIIHLSHQLPKTTLTPLLELPTNDHHDDTTQHVVFDPRNHNAGPSETFRTLASQITVVGHGEESQQPPQSPRTRRDFKIEILSLVQFQFQFSTQKAPSYGPCLLNGSGRTNLTVQQHTPIHG